MNDNGKQAKGVVELLFAGCTLLGVGLGYFIRPEAGFLGLLAGLFVGSGLAFVLLGFIWLKYGKW